MLFIRYSFDTRATIPFQFIQKTPEYYSNVFTLSVCVCDAVCDSSSRIEQLVREERFGTLWLRGSSAPKPHISNFAIACSARHMPKLPCDNALACKLFFKKVNPENADCKEYESTRWVLERSLGYSEYVNLHVSICEQCSSSKAHSGWWEILLVYMNYMRSITPCCINNAGFISESAIIIELTANLPFNR